MLVQKEAVDMTVHGEGEVFTSALSGELQSGKAPQTEQLRPGRGGGRAFEPVLKGYRV